MKSRIASLAGLMMINLPAMAGVNMYATPCDTKPIAEIPAGSIRPLSRQFVWNSAIGVDWYKVEYQGVQGWISSQVTSNPPKPKLDKSRIGKGCSFK